MITDAHSYRARACYDWSNPEKAAEKPTRIEASALTRADLSCDNKINPETAAEDRIIKKAGVTL